MPPKTPNTRDWLLPLTVTRFGGAVTVTLCVTSISPPSRVIVCVRKARCEDGSGQNVTVLTAGRYSRTERSVP